MKNHRIEKIRQYKGSVEDFKSYWNDRIKDDKKEKPLKESRAFLPFKDFIKTI